MTKKININLMTVSYYLVPFKVKFDHNLCSHTDIKKISQLATLTYYYSNANFLF